MGTNQFTFCCERVLTSILNQNSLTDAVAASIMADSARTPCKIARTFYAPFTDDENSIPYFEMLDVLERCALGEAETVVPLEFVQWTQTKKFDIFPKLTDAVYYYSGQAMVTGPTAIGPPMPIGTQADARKPDQRQVDQASYMNKSQAPKNDRNPIHPKERNSLHRIIAAMAVDALGCTKDANLGQTISEIESASQRLHISVSDDTIRKHLGAALECIDWELVES